MALEPVEVTAHWTGEGRFEPSQFTWRGMIYQIESTGRTWEDEDGFHVLCMVPAGRVYELVFHLKPAGWLVRPPNTPSFV